MPEELDSSGAALLKLLVSLLPSVDPNDPRTYTSYKEVHARLGLQQSGPTYGTSLNSQGMGSLAEWASERGFPAITGLITRESDHLPEKGFFGYYGKDEIADIPWWLAEVAKAKSFDWNGAVQGHPAIPAVSSGRGITDIPAFRYPASCS
jgi:hypothetical protein